MDSQNTQNLNNSPQNPSSPHSEAKETTQNGTGSDIAALKILIPRVVAGKLIGKGGSTITQIQEETSATIRISNPQTFFPNTQDRILLIKSTPSHLMVAQRLVVSKIFEQGDNAKSKVPTTLNIVVPTSAAGHLIGQGGTTIQDLCVKSGARIQFASKEQPTVNGERIASIYGSPDVCIEAVSLIVEKMLEQPQYFTYKNMSLTYPNRLFTPNQFQPMMLSGGMHQSQTVSSHPFASNNFQSIPLSNVIHATTTIEMEISDELVGAVIGKRGQKIIQIQQMTGTKVTLSKRDEQQLPNQKNSTNGKKRLLTIVGTSQAAYAAQSYISAMLQNAVITKQIPNTREKFY